MIGFVMEPIILYMPEIPKKELMLRFLCNCFAVALMEDKKTGTRVKIKEGKSLIIPFAEINNAILSLKQQEKELNRLLGITYYDREVIIQKLDKIKSRIVHYNSLMANTTVVNEPSDVILIKIPPILAICAEGKIHENYTEIKYLRDKKFLDNIQSWLISDVKPSYKRSIYKINRKGRLVIYASLPIVSQFRIQLGGEALYSKDGD